MKILNTMKFETVIENSIYIDNDDGKFIDYSFSDDKERVFHFNKTEYFRNWKYSSLFY